MEIGKGRRKFAGYPPAIHNLSNETRFEVMEGNMLRKLQEEDEVWKEVIPASQIAEIAWSHIILALIAQLKRKFAYD